MPKLAVLWTGISTPLNAHVHNPKRTDFTESHRECKCHTNISKQESHELRDFQGRQALEFFWYFWNQKYESLVSQCLYRSRDPSPSFDEGLGTRGVYRHDRPGAQ